MFCSYQKHNESYNPPPCEAELREQLGMAEECKFIVFKSQLRLLFKPCHACDLKLKTSIQGTLLIVGGTCPDAYGQILDWQSQPMVN